MTTIAASGNNVYVVWQDVLARDNSELLFRRSIDGGGTFGSVINLSNSVVQSIDPAIAAYGNNVYVVWRESKIDPKIRFRRSTDGGQTFNSAINLYISTSSENIFSPVVAAVGDDVYVIWIYNSETPNFITITLRRSTNFGGTFGSVANIAGLSNNFGMGFYPDISADTIRTGNNVYVAWGDNPSGNNAKTLYRRSINGGDTFSSDIDLSPAAGDSFKPAIATSGHKVYVVWRFETSLTSKHVRFRRSLNDGSTFDTGVNLSNNPASDEFPPAVAATGNQKVYVAWDDVLSGKDQVRFRRSLNGGDTFSSAVNLSNSAADTVASSIAAAGDNVYVILFESGTGLLFRRSLNNGATISSAEILS